MVFFSKNKKTAEARAKRLGQKGKVVLAKNQIKHISGWKTWKIV